jgi:molecular chaperone GrpE (heat shock protein)
MARKRRVNRQRKPSEQKPDAKSGGADMTEKTTNEEVIQSDSDNADTSADVPLELGDRVIQIEKLVRGLSRDSLATTRSQRELQGNVQAMRERLDDIELATKSVSQEVWRAMQDNGTRLEKTEQYFASAIRELEHRLTEELKWQLHKTVFAAIFPAMNDLDLSIEHQNRTAGAAEDKFLEGILLIRQKFDDGFQKLGLDEILINEGETLFDPSLHEAVDANNSDDVQSADVPSGTIIQVRRKGYTLNGRLFRAPLVIVKQE